MTGVVRFGVDEAAPERSAWPYRVALFNDAGAPLPAGNVQTITATLVAVRAGTVLFAARGVKNANGGVLVDGAFSLVLAGDDLQLEAAEADLSYAERRLTLVITATGDGGVALPIHREVHFFVQNLADVP